MLEKDITKLGLSDKEAKIYLASLELGPSPVQIISQKSKVNRATTYVIIDSLMEMGLMSTYDEGKKTYFVAEQPERLLDFLKNEKSVVEKKLELLQEKMPELKSLISNVSGKPKIKYFEGLEGLRAVQRDFIDSLREGEEIYIFLPMDDFSRTNLKESADNLVKEKVDKRIKTKIIYTSRNGRWKEYEKKEEIKSKEYLYIDYSKYPFNGGMNLYGNKIFMIDYLGKMGGIVIENKTLADMLKRFFELIWSCHKK